MLSYRLTAIVCCCAILIHASILTATELPAAERDVARPKPIQQFDGWRAVRRVELTSGHTHAGASNSEFAPRDLATSTDATDSVPRILGQSPDEDFDTMVPAGPGWSYPSRRATTSVPVPDYGGQLDTSRLRNRSDSLALNSFSRSSAASRPRSSPAAASYPYQAPQSQSPIYESPPDLPSFHAAPFERPAPMYSPTYGPDPNPCAPCQELPFEDQCAKAYQGCRYTWDSIYFFALADAFRLDHESTRAGGRFGFNWGLPVIDDESGLGIQFGLAGSVMEEGPQWFATSGVFYRGDANESAAWNVGAVFDWMHDNEIGAGIGQVRGMTSFTLGRRNEIGVWAALSVIDDDDKNGHKAEAVNQANLFYRYLFDSGSNVSVSVGWRTEPESPAVGGTWYLPINDYWAGLFGGYYAFDGDTWNVYSGVVRHWGNRARQDYIGQDRHLPYLPVADNSTMTLFHKR